MKKKRNLFAEITEGFDAFAAERAGKITLRRHTVEHPLRPKSSLGYAGNLIFRALYLLAICVLTNER